MNTTVITIDGGTVEFPLDYMVRVQHMLKRADKLQKLWDVKEIMRRYNCPFPSLGVDVPSNMPHDIAVEKACLFIADFLREENIRSLMMPVAKFSSETCEEFNLEYTDEENAQYIRQCDFSKLDVGNYPEWNQAIMIHEEGLRLGNRGLATYRTGTYIVHPSVAALIANEATWQKTHRFTGYAGMISGLLLIVVSFFFKDIINFIVFAFILVVFVSSTTIASYIYYKEEKKEGR